MTSNSDELQWLGASALAKKIQAREISAREAVDAALSRIETTNGPLNAVVTLDADAARTAADAADAMLASGARLPVLHGVPITIKDSWQTQGLRTTCGTQEFADYVPQEDAWPVRRLRDAGCIILGKTNLPAWAADMQSYNPLFGTANNPHDLRRTPGGSSGGAAAALAAGMTPLELGSDIGGSIRLPAHMCGVTGHKPSFGIVPAHGQIPGPPGSLTAADLAVAGPMAREVEDLEIALGVLAGPDRWNEPAWRLELPAPRATSLAGLRIAAWLDDDFCPLDSESARLMGACVDGLAADGIAVDTQARPEPSLEEFVGTFDALLQAAMAGGVSHQAIERFAADQDPGAAGQTRRRMALRHRAWLSHNERRLQMRLKFEEFFEKFDLLLMPVMSCPAFEHDQSEPIAARTQTVEGRSFPYLELGQWMAPAGACYLPATVVPIGQTPSGLPVGIQIVAPYLHDRTALMAAKELLERHGGCPRPNSGT